MADQSAVPDFILPSDMPKAAPPADDAPEFLLPSDIKEMALRSRPPSRQPDSVLPSAGGDTSALPNIPDFSVYAKGSPGPDASTSSGSEVAPSDVNIPDFSVYANGGTGENSVGSTAARQPSNPGVLANDKEDGWISGAAKGAATAAIQGAADIPGMSGNLNDFGNYISSRVESYLTGVPLDQVMSKWQTRRTALQQKIDEYNPLPGSISVQPLPNGDQFAAPILKKTGEYVPETTLGRIGMTGTRAAVGSALTGGAGATAKALSTGSDVLGALDSGAVSAIKAAPEGFAAGAAGQGATEATGDPLAGLAAGAVAPAAASKAWQWTGAPTVGKYLAPLAPGSRRNMVSDMLGEAAADPEQALSTASSRPDQIIPGSHPNLAEQTGDIGLSQATKAAGIADPTFAASQTAAAGEQNAARAGALNDIAPPAADMMSPATHLSQQLKSLDAAHDQVINGLTQKSAAENGAIPANFNPDLAGDDARGAIQVASDAAAKLRSHLYSLVDPENKLSVVTVPARDAGLKLQSEMDPRFSIPSPIATPVIDMVANLPDVTPFRKLTDLDSTITNEMVKAKIVGDYTGHYQLQTLKNAVMNSINNATENQHAWEQSQVANGAISSADTIKARIFGNDENPVVGNPGGNRGANDVARAVGDPTPRETPFLGKGVEEGSQGSGLRGFAGSEGVQAPQSEARPQGGIGEAPAGGSSGTFSGSAFAKGTRPAQPPPEPTLQPNFDAAAAQRLDVAKKAHADFAQTYREGPVEGALADNGFRGQYTAPGASLPAKIFPAGNTGYAVTSSFLNAAKNSPEAISAIQDMAMDRLKSGHMKGGDELTPAALAAWKQQYGHALRAIDEVSPGFSSRFDSAAAATKALDDAQAAKVAALKDAQEGAAGRLIAANSPGEVKARVGEMLKAADGPTQIKAVMSRMKGNKAAQEGLQRAGIEHILDSVTNAGTVGGEHIISGAKLTNLLKRHGDAVEALVGKPGVSNMKAIAADIERSQIALDNTRSRTGSDTGANVFKKLKEIAAKSGSVSVGGAIALSGIEALHNGDLLGAAGLAGLAGVRAAVGKLRSNGINKANDLYLRGLEDPEVGKALLQRYIDRQGRANIPALARLGYTIERSSRLLSPLHYTAEEKREGRKTGGRVGMSHEFLVNRLIRMVELAKREQNETTKPLLNAPDPLVAYALKLAQRGI